MKLIGKTAWFWMDGHRSGRIVRVDRGSRTGVRSLTVKLANGHRKRVEPRAFRGPLSGVMYRGELVPLDKATRPT